MDKPKDKVMSDRGADIRESASHTLKMVHRMLTAEAAHTGKDVSTNTALLATIATELTMLHVTFNEFLELTYGLTRDERQPLAGISKVGGKPAGADTQAS